MSVSFKQVEIVSQYKSTLVWCRKNGAENDVQEHKRRGRMDAFERRGRSPRRGKYFKCKK